MKPTLIAVLLSAVVLALSSAHAQQTEELRKEFEAAKARAEQGDPRSQLYLGMLYRDGRGVEKNPLEELKWYRKAAEQDYVVAQRELGRRHSGEERIKWLGRAADKNDAWSQYELGSTYEHGSGIAVPKNAAEAVKWYRKAAEQDFFQAQIRLGYCYHRGIGVAPDPVEAVKWYRVVAEYDAGEGQRALAIAYELGRGVEKNPVEAYAWRILAADRTIAAATYIKERDEFAKQLTPEQIADGQKRAAELKPLVTAGAEKRRKAQMAASIAKDRADQAVEARAKAEAERLAAAKRALIPLPARTGGTSSTGDFYRLMEQARRLTPENVAELETKLKQDPKDHWARLLLIGHRKKGEKLPPDCVELVLGLVEHHPRAPGTGAFYITLSFLYDRAALQSACAIWEKHVQAFPKDAQVLGNAAQWMSHVSMVEPKYRGQIKPLFEQARAAEPSNPLWAERLGGILIGEARALPPSESAAVMQRGIAQFEAAMRLRKISNRATYRLEGGQPYLAMLTAGALSAGETNQAKAYAVELLQNLDPKTDAWNYGNMIYSYNSMLGQIALREGKPDDAAKYLMAAGKTPGSPQLNSFGPSFTLAKELLQLGRPEDRATVMQFLDDVARFWANPETARDDRKADKAKQREEIEGAHLRMSAMGRFQFQSTSRSSFWSRLFTASRWRSPGGFQNWPVRLNRSCS